MSIARITTWLSVLAALAGFCTAAQAQFPATTHQLGGGGFWEPDHLGLVNPQIPLNYFEPDFQFFAPADVSTFGGYPEPAVGFFFSYDRLYWNVQRSETSDAPYEGDFSWGNRVDFGYMMDTDHGWHLGAFHLGGPNLFVDDETVNISRFEGVEVNKTFRWKPVHKNYIIEPMLGVRFIKFIDRDPEFIEVPNPDPTLPPLVVLLAENEVENNILGGQLGMRVHHQTERWIFAVESKILPAMNWQFYPTTDYPEFTVFGQIRFQSTYRLTRDISIGSGVDLMYFGQGIARGRETGIDFSGDRVVQLPSNDQDVFIGGFSMLFQINR
jgi:hypothetical protein